MIIKIESKYINELNYVGALSDVLVKIFTIESNNGELVQAEITNVDGSELRPEYAWCVARMMEAKIQMTELVYRKP
jgi:hypothetical protein